MQIKRGWLHSFCFTPSTPTDSCPMIYIMRPLCSVRILDQLDSHTDKLVHAGVRAVRDPRASRREWDGETPAAQRPDGSAGRHRATSGAGRHVDFRSLQRQPIHARLPVRLHRGQLTPGENSFFFLQKYCWKLSCQVRKENSCTEESQTAFVTVGDKCLGIIFVQVQYKGRVYQAARKSKIMGCIPSPRVFESSDCASRINSVLSWSQNLNENPHPVCLPCGLRFPHETAT